MKKAKRPSLTNLYGWIQRLNDAVFGNEGQKGIIEKLEGNGKPGLIQDVITIKIQNKIIIGMLIIITAAIFGQYIS